MSKNDKPSLVKVGIVYTISNIIVKGMAFITTPFFSRILSQSEYGQFSNISSWISILITIITLDLFSSVSMAKYDYDKEIKQYMSSALLFGNIVTLLFYIVFELNMVWFEDILAMSRTYIRIMFVYFFFYPAIQIYLAKYRIYNEYKNVIKMTWMNTLVAVFSQVLLVLILSDKLLGRVLGNYAAVALFSIIPWAIIIYHGRSFSSKYYRHALRLAVPLIPHVLSGILLVSSDRIMINSICGSVDAGLYSLAYTISAIASVLLTSLNQAWVPWMYDRFETDREEIAEVMKPYTLLFFVFCCGLMLFGPEAVLVMGGKAYLPSRFVVPPVVLALLLQFVYTQYVNIEFYRKRNGFISVATIVATVINIGLNYLLLPVFGYMVAAYTTVIGYLVMVISHYCVVKFIIKEPPLYAGETFLIAIALSVVMMVLSLISYNITAMRLVLIAIYVGILVFGLLKNKGRIQQMVHK